MRVFITGASGWIGSAVVPELIGAGHQVVGLARSDVSAAALDRGPQTRQATAELVLSLASRGVRSSVVRLSSTDHGVGDHGFMATLVGIARDKGISGYIGDGSSRWPAVHRLDSAHLFRLALEKAPAGSTLHAVADEGVPIRDTAEVIGRHLHLPVVSIAPDDAGEHFACLAAFLAFDSPVSSALTRELLGWQPVQPGLIDDLKQGHYFRQPSA
jgi:nucleoside-diphosphate-sugar epimerase